jgi:adenylate cyclase class 2
MFEIERKFRLNPNEAAGLKVKLEAKYGAGQKLVQHDEHFLFKKSSYAEHVTGDPVLRIRNANGNYFFTYKHTVKETGNRVEHETGISDPEALRAALVAMGWRSVVQIQKVRWHFHASGLTYDLDMVEGLGDYLEIEIVSDKDSDAEATLVSVAVSLDIPADRIERRSYGRLLQEKNDA